MAFALFSKQTTPAKKKKQVKFTWPPPYKKRRRLLLLTAGLLCLLWLLLSLLPPKMPDDYLTYVQSFMPSGMQGDDFTVALGKNVHGAVVQAELWQNGQCTEGEKITVSEDTQQLHILVSTGELNNAKGIPSVQVQLDLDNSSESSVSRFLLPTSTIGYSYSGYIDHDVVSVTPGQQVILACLAPDTGSGVQSYRCTALSEDPELLKSAACLVVVRAEFTAEELAVQSPKSSTQNNAA